MSEQFVSEPIWPDRQSLDTARMAAGMPGLPGRFTWREHDYIVARVLRHWTETSGCHHGSAEQYVRKHWFEIQTACGKQMKLYFERQPRSTRARTQRWWLFSVCNQPCA